jgi:uncharacterized protein (UPF0333 family)
MRKRAQAISEYALLIAAIATALSLMQLYFQRSVRAVVKIAADEVGDQKIGSANEDPNFEWIERTGTDVSATSSGSTTEVKSLEAAVTRTVSDTTRMEGGIAFGIAREKE